MEIIVSIVTIILLFVIGLYVLRKPEKHELNGKARQQIGGTYVRLSDGVTHYKLEGTDTGKRVVLVHGGTIPLWMWDDQVQALCEAGFQVLRYDMYGRGYSERPHIIYNQACYKRQLLELVDSMKWDAPFDFVGYPLGGATVINFTATHPERVRKLILISPVMKNYHIPRTFRPVGVGEVFARLIGIQFMIKRVGQWFAHHPIGDQMTALFAQQATYKGFQRSLLSMIRHDAFDDYTPVYQTVGRQARESLLIWGTEDTEILPPVIEDIRVCIPSIRVMLVEGAGHGIVFQAPEKVTDAIMNFLS
jgi:pimeloyl-ACP methyl ester carboxylesterase